MIRSVPWLMRRLSLMPPAEVVHRMRRETRNRVDRLLARNGRSLRKLQSVSGAEYARPHWMCDLSRRQEIQRHVQDALHWSQLPACRLLEHRFTFFGFQEKDFGNPIRWNFDYSNNVETPRTFGPAIDYRDPRRCGDIKYAWEHNRHHHLVELAKAYYLTGDSRFADEVRSQVDSWIEDCPYLFGVNWTSALEVAIRVINWCFAFRFLTEAQYAPVAEASKFRRRWIASVREHLRFIARNLSRYSSANNHLIGEASGLFVGALMFRFQESGSWLQESKRILEREALCQNWPDGVNKEQSTGYQLFVFDFIMIPALLAKENDLAFAEPVWHRLEAMAEFIAALSGPGGTLPAIGDGDDGHVVRLAYGEGFVPARSVLATAAVLFGRKDFRDIAGAIDEKTFWLLGMEGTNAFERALRVGTPKKEFPEGGYWIIEDRDVKLAFDCGPLGFLSLSAHGHADALSILLEYRGRRFLVDPGTYAYHTNPRWRDYFRGTAAHNTLRIGETDQSVSGGNFMWLEKAQARLLWYRGSAVFGRHDGYTRLRPPAIVEREVAYDTASRVIRVTDRVLTRGTYAVELFFHFDPACTCTWDGRLGRVESGGARIDITPDARVSSGEVLLGSPSPIGGWFSPGYDRKVPAPTLRFSAATAGDLELVTLIHLL